MGPLILIADRSLGEGAVRTLSEVFSVLDGHAITVLERWHGDLQGERWARLRRIHALCQAHGASLRVSARADMALAIGADGIHLPETGLPAAPLRALGLKTGRSCHSRTQLEQLDADYAFLSPIAPPHSKVSALAPLGLEGFQAACQAIDAPVYGLGGIDDDLTYELARAGAAGVATIGRVLGSISPRDAALSLWHAWCAGVDARHRSVKADSALVDKGPLRHENSRP